MSAFANGQWRCVLVVVGVLGLASAVAGADDAFYEVPANELRIISGELPSRTTNNYDWKQLQQMRLLMPYAVLDSEGEVYLGSNVGLTTLDVLGQFSTIRLQTESGQLYETPNALAVRAEAGKEVTGTIYVPKADLSGMTPVRFSIPANKAKPEAHKNFYLAKYVHYRRLGERDAPGTAWFRHQARQAAAEVTGASVDELAPEERQRRAARPDLDGYEDTFQIFSGGRAISENLQLDRLIAPTKPAPAAVDIDTLEGITVAEMDWGPLVKDIDPRTDALAKFLPADQHVVLFPSFQAMVKVADEATVNGTPLLHILQPRAEDAQSRGRYERQLCLSLDPLSRLTGAQFISGVALTGSDPYLRTGTDVAVLFETNAAEALTAFLTARQLAAAKTQPNCETINGKAAGIDYSGVRSADRGVCSYLAAVDGCVIVTNSLVQIERLAAVREGKAESLASLPEYRFFRDRYKLGDEEEAALLIVTDATIRRWCGPKWRIGTSRRTRAAAVMAEHHARHLAELVQGNIKPRQLETNMFVADLGELSLAASGEAGSTAGVVSSTYGSLDFQTPIAELNIAKVTDEEAQSYKRWRDTYQQYWRQFFDPIAVSFSTREDRLAADVTVMPLIARSDYESLIGIVGRAKIKPDAGDRHAGTLAHWTMAIDLKSQYGQFAENFLQAMKPAGLQGSPLSWLGESISVYADADPFWGELAAAEKSDEFAQKNAGRIPVALQVEVANSLKLSLFLTGLRAFIEQTSPGLTRWESLKHNDRGYVRISPAEAETGGLPRDFAIYYAATPTQLVFTLNEDLLKRSLDRVSARAKADKADAPAKAGNQNQAPPAKGEQSTPAKGDQSPPAERERKLPAKGEPAVIPPLQRGGPRGGSDGEPWLGTSLALQVDGRAFGLLGKSAGESYNALMQSRSWGNLHVLNEWKRRFPKEDPLTLHERYWQTKLRCPGGGEYVWNEEFQTMQSTVYGHPGEPKSGPPLPAVLNQIRHFNFGVTFENAGLRARVALKRGEE